MSGEFESAKWRERAPAGANLIQSFFYNNPDFYPPIINGARLLAEAGFSLDIYCRDDGRRSEIIYPSAVRMHRIKSSSGNSWKEYANFIREVLRRASRKSQVFVGHDMHGLLPAKLLAKRFKRPLVYQCYDYANNNSSTHTIGSRIVHQFQRRFAHTADLITIPDSDLGAVMARELRLRQKPLVVANAPNERFTATGRALHEALAARGMRFQKIVLRQGRIGEGHAIEATLRSIPQWRGNDWGFVVMGIGETSYIERLSTLAQSLKVEARFVALPPVSYDRIGEFTTGADLGHALYEPIHINNVHITGSNKIQEYMAAGLPLLVSDRPSLRALVEKHGCGLAADESSPESIAQAVNTLLGDEELARRMGEAARRAFEEELCYKHQFAPVVERIQRLIAGRHSA